MQVLSGGQLVPHCCRSRDNCIIRMLLTAMLVTLA